MRPAASVVVVVITLLTAACSSVPPPTELADARAAYERAATGPAARLAPLQLRVAKEDLERAEEWYRWDDDSFRTRDLAYVALREAELADAAARTTEYRVAQNIADHRVRLTSAVVAGTANGLRAETERRMQQAATALVKVAAVKQDARGTVVTLRSDVLFAPGKSDLSPEARAKVAEVADALARVGRGIFISIVGHTDTVGSTRFNMDLSQRRADAVRDALVERGVSPNRVTAAGVGPGQPVSDNQTPEGRAENRRVELIVQPTTTSAK